jgi:hypothetical protein
MPMRILSVSSSAVPLSPSLSIDDGNTMVLTAAGG